MPSSGASGRADREQAAPDVRPPATPSAPHPAAVDETYPSTARLRPTDKQGATA